MAPLVHKLKCDSRFLVKLCVTGQHREMLDSVLALFRIHPEFDLGVMRPGQDLTDVAVSIQVGMSCLLYTSPSPRDRQKSRMPSSA